MLDIHSALVCSVVRTAASPLPERQDQPNTPSVTCHIVTTASGVPITSRRIQCTGDIMLDAHNERSWHICNISVNKSS